ncbi:Stp1/IreP family PP2C-type Ser/Thr phosphatase [Salipaludibacillus sp. CUR1]|uniref:Stp1/IreP family PP2C-type Ser/Thr phosphatase n=1 Tax=Salipaludibacillus sp. CUR1 TaxID=2820003 RepID=UPI001E4EA749|nr:Stp1/IreP family PP2C-type Ser/Thr phosphatase [Salipaludibacillus sp. CUR1]MCE7794657.1 Stp1/IreP family PP2C-type Ser/Thr phosphatase [Salipaludibacillus sp. CUR1]
MKGIFRTHTGKVRPHNEDDGAVKENQTGHMLALVADGMGGHQAGDVASKMARDGLLNYWKEIDKQLSPKEAEEWLNDTVQKLNKEIFLQSRQNAQCEGMGTTLVAAVCTDEYVSFSNVGDSRVYLFEDRQLKQMTEDHSLVGELVRSGQISEEEAEHHPRKNVLLRALGTEKSIEVDVRTISWREGDMLLLCSDGLTNMVSDEEISSYLSSSENLDEIAAQLVDHANKAGGEDNISLTLVRHETEGVSHT